MHSSRGSLVGVTLERTVSHDANFLEESCDFSSDDIHLICWSLTLESRIELCLFGPFGLSQNRHTPEVRAFRPNLTFGPKAKISAKQSSPPSSETASINSP
jgi:hypothetical protein